MGEVAAARACGALDLDVAIGWLPAAAPGRETRGTGHMAAVELSVENRAHQLSGGELGEALDITIAGINSPKNLTLSGSLADRTYSRASCAQGCLFPPARARLCLPQPPDGGAVDRTS